MAVISKKYKGSKTWYVVKNTTINGKTKREYLSDGLSTKADAMALDAKMKVKKTRRITQAYTLKDVYDEFLNGYSTKKDVKKGTVESLQYMSLHFLQKLQYKPITNIDYADIEDLKQNCAQNGLSNRTINIVLLNLKKILNHALYSGYISELPPIIPVSETAQKKIRRLYNEEIQALMANANTGQQRFITLMLQTGLRPNEAFNLKWIHINFKQRFIEVVSENKLKTGRKIPLTEALISVLLESRIETKSEYVIQYRRADVARNAIRRIAKRAGIEDPSVYMFRKTFGSMMAEAGVPVFELAKLMGHSNISTTYKYYIDIQHKTLESAMAKMPDFRYTFGTFNCNDMKENAMEVIKNKRKSKEMK